MINILQYFFRTDKLFNFHKYNLTVIIVFLLMQVGYGQNSSDSIDSINSVTDTINNLKLPKVTIKNGSKIYIVKGTVVKNLDVDSNTNKQIVYVEPKTDKEKIKTLKEVNQPILVKNKSKSLQKKIESAKDKQYTTEIKKVSKFPFSNSNFYSAKKQNSIITNNTLNNSFSISKSIEFIQNIEIETLFRKSYYNYVRSSYSISISTLEIRSPSFYI